MQERTTVFVVMGNDFPDSVFSTQEQADAFCAMKRAEPKSRICWRVYDFAVDAKAPDAAPAPSAAPEAIGKDGLASTLADALRDAEQHLSFCGYGDRYERECAYEQKLPEKIEAAIAAADKAGV